MDPEGIYGGKEDAGLPPRVNGVNGIEHGGPSPGSSGPCATDDLDIPDSFRRTGHRCDHCGSIFGAMKRRDWPGRPDGIWLHPRCEAPWHDGDNPLSRQPLNGGTFGGSAA
jgi:hypothetical protein